MGVSYLPGFEQQLAPAAAQLAAGLERFINPNAGFQRVAQAQILQNPQIAQQLADLEKLAPGFLQGLGLGGLSEHISAVPQSLDAMIAAGARPAVAEVLRDKSMVREGAIKTVTGQTSTQLDAGTLSKKFTELGMKALEDPEVAAFVGRKTLGYEPGAVAKDKFEASTLGTAAQMLAEGVDINIKKFLNNEYTPEQLTAIYSTPMGKALDAQLEVYMNNIRAKAAKDSKGDTLEKYYQGRAYDLSKLTGTFDMPAALQVVKGEVTPTTATGDAKKIYDKLAQMNAEDRGNYIRKFDEDIALAMTRFGNVKEGKGVDKKQAQSTREGIVRQINSLLEGRTPAGVPKYTVEYVPPKEPLFWFNTADQMVFKDEFGNTVAPEQALAGLPPAPGAQSDSIANQAYQLIVGLKPELRAEALRKLEARGDMEVYAKVLQKLGTTSNTVTVTP